VIAAATATGPRIGITGIAANMPDRVLDNAEVAAPLGVTEDWIVTRTGIEERRIASADEAASDLAIPAACAALAQAGAEPASVDLVIVATATPDTFTPATAAVVASAIGATGAAAYDVSAASTGFVYALVQAYAAVAAGASRRALVVCSEVLSRITNWRDRDTCVLFGDGAAAVVVEPVARGGLLGFELGSDGTAAGDLVVPAGGSRLPATPQTVRQDLHALRMDGMKIFRLATRITSDSVSRVLTACSLSVADVDLYAPHQSNRRIIDYSAARLGVPPERVLVNVQRYGNTSSVSIPLVLADAAAEGRLRPGHTVLLSAVGAGLTWGSAVIGWTAEGAG
jgi:3-oxoacyl-[acyl-carrier-protein] synthase-3